MTSASHVMETWRSHPFLGALIPAAPARPETCASFPVHAVLPPGSGSPKTPQLARSPGSGGSRLQRTSMPAESDPEGGSQDGSSAHVLHHAEPAVRPENAAHFGQPLSRIRDATEHETAHHRVEGTIAKRQRLRAGAHERNFRRSPPGAPQCVRGRIEPNRARLAREQTQAPSSAAAEVQRAPPRTPRKPLAPAAHPLPLCEGTHRVVDPGDLLDATHRP